MPVSLLRVLRLILKFLAALPPGRLAFLYLALVQGALWSLTRDANWLLDASLSLLFSAALSLHDIAGRKSKSVEVTLGGQQ